MECFIDLHLILQFKYFTNCFFMLSFGKEWIRGIAFNSA